MRIPSSLRFLPIFLALCGEPSRASFIAIGTNGSSAPVSLISSKVTVRIGPAWLDIEEDAELSVNTQSTLGPWILDGQYAFPFGSVVTGCFLWNEDTLLMGKLRVRSDAGRKFDSLVPPPPLAYRQDPLLVEQTGDSTYHLRLYPVTTRGSRRIRLRYLVPLNTGTVEVPVTPVFCRNPLSSMPPTWDLEVRGAKVPKLKIRHDGAWFPLNSPSSRIMRYTYGDDVSLGWGSGVDGNRAVRGRMDSGAWKGDYVLFTGAIPDSIGRRLGVRSETVFLWKWLSPQTFQTTDSYGNINSDYISLAVQQAQMMVDLSGQMVQAGNKVGLVADQGLDDTNLVFPVSDSTGESYRKMREWLTSIDDYYIRWKIASVGSEGNTPGSASDIANSQHRFSVDIRSAGALYSKDSGIVRHLVVVTVGPVPSGADLEVAPDLTGLPSEVSVASSSLNFNPQNTCNAYGCGYMIMPPSRWPGVDLNKAVLARPGIGDLDSLENVPMPKLGSKVPIVLSMGSAQGLLQKEAVVERNPDGSWKCSMDLQATGIGNEVTWNVYDDHGNPTRSWVQSPSWVRADGDSALPLLWAASPNRTSPNYAGLTTLAPIFGFVDHEYSLLAMPSDSLGRVRQAIYADSGLPFLSPNEIFPRTGYAAASTPTTNPPVLGIHRALGIRSGLSVRLIAQRRIRIGFEGFSVLSIEVRDLRGRKVAGWDAASLAGKVSVVWNGRNPSGSSVPSGLYVVVVRTSTKTLTASVALP